MLPIQRFTGTAPGRSSAVVYGNLVFTVAVADITEMDMRKQTADALAKIDRQLAKAGTDKSRLLQATVYITDMALKAQMNEIWLGWIDPDNAPQRACIGATLEGHHMLEIVAVAATKD
ncbi:RidA family protein [Ferrovibrio xuzhouensis]|uniref:RidA family protein n=1 Tax=Ferrovibrio xuzhouensis TaxID=1576914 RepID=A0ABV7VEC9_9PROT